MRKLNLFVNGKHVAILQEEPSPLTGRPQYRLAYLPSTPPDQYLSLSLPVTKEPYIVDEIPFSLRQNLPEGERLVRLKQLGKVVDVSDNFGMLSVVGNNTVGRVSVSELEPVSGIPAITLHDATAEGKLLFKRLFYQYGITQGISGVQEKVLANEMLTPDNQLSIIADKFILKSFNAKHFPALAENEYWTTIAAKQCGISASDVFLSDDFSTLIVRRFDVLPDGNRLALDEACALAGFSNEQKYLASYETVADLLFKYCTNVETDALAFFKQIAFMVAVKNGDAHLKNFALLSGDGIVRLAPAYDLVSTGVYVNESEGEFENPAMPLENSRWEKHWWSREKLLEFGEYLLGLNSSQMNSVFEEIECGLQETTRMMERHPASMDFSNKIMPALVGFWENPFDLKGYGEIPLKQGKPKF